MLHNHFLDRYPFSYDIRMYALNKNEVFQLNNDSLKGSPVRFWADELGNAVAEFIYDTNFDDVVSYLKESYDWVVDIKDSNGNRCANGWNFFHEITNRLASFPMLNPFYYVLLSEIGNAYISGMRMSNGEFYDSAYFAKIADEHADIKLRVLEFVNAFLVREEQDGSAWEIYLADEMKLDYILSDVVVEKVPAKEYKKNTTMEYAPCYVLHPKNIESFWNYLSIELIKENVLFKRCAKCGKLFVATGRSNVKYCDRLYQDTGKTCRQLMPVVVAKNTASSSVADKLYTRASRTMYSRVTAKTIDKKMYKAWSKEAREKRDECKAGVITPEEYSAWLCESGINKNYLKGGL